MKVKKSFKEYISDADKGLKGVDKQQDKTNKDWDAAFDKLKAGCNKVKEGFNPFKKKETKVSDDRMKMATWSKTDKTAAQKWNGKHAIGERQPTKEETEVSEEGYQNWPGEKKKKFFQTKETSADTKAWAERKKKEREEAAKKTTKEETEVSEMTSSQIKKVMSKAHSSKTDKSAAARDSVSKELEKKKVKEETELDEVSKDTLKSYVDKATKDRHARYFNVNTDPNIVNKKSGSLKKSYLNSPEYKAKEKKLVNRFNGLALAKKKLGEETELSELSVGTLKDYMNKAATDIRPEVGRMLTVKRHVAHMAKRQSGLAKAGEKIVNKPFVDINKKDNI